VPKATDAFRNIGEVSAELGIKKHVLRFWEMKFPQLKPMKRGGGRRLYRPTDVHLLKGIRDLLQSAGYTIKGVQKILRERGVDQVKAAAEEAAIAAARQPHRGRGGKAAPAAPAPASRPLLLSVLEVRTLHTIKTELEACRGLLTVAAAKTPAKRRYERAAE
jgi:DNA-binding transcriptional MerR regulator